jgi:hypothetical protein
MGKRSNPMSVKAALTYDVIEAACALGKTPATIRNWIRDGLEVMSSQKPNLISGAAIQEYLRAKYRAAKRPLDSDQLFCPSCRKGQRPKQMAVTLSHISAHTSLLKGQCARCGGTCTRMISTPQVESFSATFQIKKKPNSGAY